MREGAGTQLMVLIDVPLSYSDNLPLDLQGLHIPQLGGCSEIIRVLLRRFAEHVYCSFKRKVKACSMQNHSIERFF